MGNLREKFSKMLKGELISKILHSSRFNIIKAKNSIRKKIKSKDRVITNLKLPKNKYVLIAIGTVVAVIIISVPIMIYTQKNAYTNFKKLAKNKAEEYFYLNEYDNSINEYKKLDEKEKWPIWKAKIAEVFSVEGKTKESNELIKDVLRLRNEYINEDSKKDKNFVEKDEELVNLIVYTQYMNNDFEGALKNGEEFRKLYRDFKPLIKTMFTIYMSNEKIEEAKGLIEGYPVDKNSSYDLATFARMKMLVEKWDEGFTLLENAWNLDKDEYKVYDVLAQIAAYNKNDLLEKLIDLSQKNEEKLCYKMWIAKVYSMDQDSSEEAMKILNELDGKDTGKIVINLIKASVLQNTQKETEADALITKIIEENKDDYRVYHTASWYYLKKKDYDKAFDYCNESILKNKDYPDNYGFLMPEILKAMSKSQEAEPFFRTALEKEPFNYNILLNIANYYWYTTQDLNKAYEHFYKASLIKPQDGEIVYNMALIKLKAEKIDECIELLKKAISKDDSSTKFHRTLGTIYLQQGKNSEALKEIRFAYQTDKNDILTLNNAGCYYFSVDGDVERGMVNFKGAYTGINNSTDENTKKVITENYEKAKKLYDEYMKANGATLKVPDFTLFY